MTPTEWLERLQVQMVDLLIPHGFRNFPDRRWYFQRGNLAYLISWDYREKLFWASFYRDVQARQSVNLVSLDLSTLEAESEQAAKRCLALVLEAVAASLRDLPPATETVRGSGYQSICIQPRQLWSIRRTRIVMPRSLQQTLILSRLLAAPKKLKR